MLQILEDGRLTDSQGRNIDFKNTVIIMTTNLGTGEISKGVMTGFTSATDTTTNYERMKAKVTQELRQHFRPEFLNRVDDTIVFPQLDQDEIVKIVDLFVNKLRARLGEQNMTLEVEQPARQFLAEQGYDPSMGARPLRRTIQHLVEDQLSERILYGEIPGGAEITIGVTGSDADRKLTFDWKIPAENQIESNEEPAAIES